MRSVNSQPLILKATSSYYNETKVCLSDCPSLSGKNWRRDKHGKSTVECGSGMGLSSELVEDMRGRKGEAKNAFCGACRLGVGMTRVLGWR